ncbi:MAG: hypothetical protein AAF721_04580 [Myxococcota bacterium]
MRVDHRLLLPSLASASLLAAGCPESGGGNATAADAETEGATATTTGGSPLPDSDGTDGGSTGPAAPTGALPPSQPVDLAWTVFDVGVGSKPEVAVSSDGTVHVASIYEEQPGWIRWSAMESNATGPGAEVDVAVGYFYGPIALGTLSDGAPVIAYHDHDLEDQVLATGLGGDGFDLAPMANPGHDGWYSSLHVTADDRVHTATFDPMQFGGMGVFYGTYDGSWTTALAVPGAFDYINGTSIAVGPDGTVYIATFSDAAGEPLLARIAVGGDWQVSTIEPRGSHLDVGFFPSLVIAPDGTLHLTYLVRDEPSSGQIRYARGGYDTLELFDAADFNDVSINFEGARSVSTLAILPDGRPVVAYQTTQTTNVLIIGDDEVLTNTVATTEGSTPFGQQTSIATGDDGQIHLVWWIHDGSVPGTVQYARATAP